MLRLLTIPISHYCERARWALDRAGLDYEEEQHLQTFHLRPVRAWGARHSVPLLVTDGHLLPDSDDILRWTDRQLPPERRLCGASAEADELSTRLAGDFGVESRRWAYGYFFRASNAALVYNDGHAPRWERALLRLLRPAIEPRMRAFLGMEPQRMEAALSFVHRTFDELDACLADGRPYLAGDRLSAADVTFASLAAPVVLPTGYGMPLPTPAELPPDAARVIEAFRERPAGKHVLRLYERDRPPVRARFV